MLDKLDTVLLALDELVDGGVILEIEPSAIVNRVGMRGADADQMGGMGGVSMGSSLQSQTPQQALQSIKDTMGTMARAFKAAGT